MTDIKLCRSAILCVCLICISLAFIPIAQAQDAAAGVEIGEINGAAFRIEVPQDWNGGLVMYAHGYATVGSPLPDYEQTDNPLRTAYLSRGFAIAESAYSKQGWAVKEALEDTEAVRRHFVQRYGQPNTTIITGHSMGGVITMGTIERYPEVYEGALPICGPLSPALDFMENHMFDMLVTFDYLFGTHHDDVPILADPTSESLNLEAVQAALDAKPETANRFALLFNAKPEHTARVLGFFQVILKELVERTGGNPLDNRNTVYAGFEDDVAVNRGVQRYAADPAAQEYLKQYYSPTGRISDPVLALHTTYDQLVPADYLNYYDVVVTREGNQDRFAMQFVAADGHCNISAEKTGAAFDDLLNWVTTGTRPTPGER